MARVALSSIAYEDAAAILENLRSKAGVAIAQRYDADIKAVLRRLAAFPESGAPRPALGARTRIAIAHPYVVFHEYDAAADIVFVLRILDGRREITRRLLRQSRPRR